ncbi:MAG TPA: glycosyltransferase [Solirubrobacteraceae bacterium]|jgi:glycosyltransferase involved in cell wall biosynthesis|nr:glycosyltransferase [Solirubrobacteraceae bacterium]
MRALVVTNMYPSPTRPALGGFVRDQVRALQRIDDLDVQLHAFEPGPRNLLRAGVDLRRRFAGERFDVVHAHFGLTAWPALAVAADNRLVTLHGNDVYHPRSRGITAAVLGRMDLIGTPSPGFAADVPRAGAGRPIAILPCGIDVDRFRPIDRRAAREQLGLDPDGRYLLFPYDPARAVKRVDRARELAGDDAQLLTLGSTPTDEVPLWMNAANAVVCPADWETFGLACIEALACDVPVLARPTGVHAEALGGIAGTLCAEWDVERWRAALAPHLAASDPRIAGRARAQRYSAAALAARVATAWRWLVSDGPPPPLYSAAEAPIEPSLGAPSS